MTFRNLKAALVAAVSMSALAQGAHAESLAEALTSAYNNSGLLDQNRAVLRAADEGVAQAVASLRPTLSWSAQFDTGYSSTYNIDLFEAFDASYALSSTVTLYDHGAGRLAVESAKESVLGTRAALVNVEQTVLLRAISAYLAVRTAQEFVSLRRSNVNVLDQEVSAARDRFDVGEVTRTDVSQAEAALASASSLLAVAQGELQNANEEYRAAIGHLPANLTQVPLAPIPRGETEARAYARQNHPTVVQAQHTVTAAELNIQRTEAARKPSASLTGGVQFDDQLNDQGTLSVTVGGPIYQGGNLDSVLREARAGRDQVRAALHVAAVQAEQDVAGAYANYGVARAAREAYGQQIQAAQLAFDGVREEANAGSRTTLDVLTAEQDLLDARANFVSAQADEIAATYNILESMGLLTVEHLKLPVQVYDVVGHYNLVKDAPLAISEQGRALDRVLQAIGN